jgi:hypothetical protein
VNRAATAFNFALYRPGEEAPRPANCQSLFVESTCWPPGPAYLAVLMAQGGFTFGPLCLAVIALLVLAGA